MAEANFFSNLLGGYTAGVERQREEAIRLANQVFRQSELEWQKEKATTENDQWNKKYNLDVTAEANRDRDRAADNARDLITRVENAWKNGATGEQIMKTFSPYAEALGIELPNVSAWGESPVIAEKRRHNGEMETNILKRISAGERTNFLKMKRQYVDRLIKEGVSPVDAEALGNQMLDVQAGGDGSAALAPPASMQPTQPNAPSPLMPQQQSPDLMGMLTGQNSPAMPAGQPQGDPVPQGGMTGNYDPTKPLPGIQAKNDYMAQLGAAALTRQKISLDKNTRDAAKSLVDIAHKKATTERLKTLTPLERKVKEAQIRNYDSQIATRAGQLSEQRKNNAIDRGYKIALTDKARNPQAVKEWGMKNRLQLETQMRQSGQEWRRNKQITTNLLKQQESLLDSDGNPPTNPAERATYDRLQQDINESAAMAKSYQDDYAFYQGIRKEVGFFDPKTPQGQAERGNANTRDLPVQPRNQVKGLPKITPEAEVRARQPKGSKIAPLKTTQKVFNVNGKTVKVRRIN